MPGGWFWGAYPGILSMALPPCLSGWAVGSMPLGLDPVQSPDTAEVCPQARNLVRLWSESLEAPHYPIRRNWYKWCALLLCFHGALSWYLFLTSSCLSSLPQLKGYKISVQYHNVLVSIGHINPPTVLELFLSAYQNNSLLIFSLKLYFPLFLFFPASYNLFHHNGIFPCFCLISVIAQKTYVSPPSATASLCLIDSWLFLDPILFSDPWLLTPSIIKISISGVWVI